MSFVQSVGISIAFGNRDILDSINLNLGPNSKAALSGSNGSGKSTLMKILANLAKPDSGKIHSGNETRIAYLPQTGITHAGNSVTEEVNKAFFHIEKLIKKKTEIENILQNHNSSNKDTEELILVQHELEEKIVVSGYYDRDKKIEQVLVGLGFEHNSLKNDCNTFSGGWQMRIALATTLLQHPDILLLDEPTNYLDIEAREWLGDFLKNYHGGFLLVSHDRYFLDSTVNEIYELFQGNLNRYKGSYSAYEKIREVELESLIKQYKKQREEIEKNEQFIRRFRAQATKASSVQSRVKQLSKIKPIILPDNMKKVTISFPPPPHCGDSVLDVQNLTKRYDAFQVFSDINFNITKGEKVAFTGFNGAGKTTMLKAIANIDTDYSGQIKLGSGVNIGYFAQDSSESLDNSLSIEKEIEKECPTQMYSKIRTLAGSFLFSDDDFYKKVSILSGGERNRLTLLKLMLQPHNLLILDEPTNHLDIHSKNILLDALKKFSGTVLFVSHDHYFLEQLATKVIHLENGTHTEFLGDYNYYLWKLENKENDFSPQPSDKPKETSFGKLNHKQQKELRNRIKKLETEEENLLLTIDEIETEIKACENSMQLPENYTNQQKAVEIAKNQKELEIKLQNITNQWDSTAEKLTQLNIEERR